MDSGTKEIMMMQGEGAVYSAVRWGPVTAQDT